MSYIRSLTFEKQSVAPVGDLYDITMPIPAGNMILSSARVDIRLGLDDDYVLSYDTIPKSISLEIGTVIGNDFVIDNDTSMNFFKVILDLSTTGFTVPAVLPATVDKTRYYLSSTTYPNTTFKMNGPLQRQCVFRIRDSSGNIIFPDYFCFHFTVISDN